MPVIWKFEKKAIVLSFELLTFLVQVYMVKLEGFSLEFYNFLLE